MVHPLGIYVALCTKAAYIIHNNVPLTMAEELIIVYIQIQITIFALVNLRGKSIVPLLSNLVFYQEALKKGLTIP